jgi:hypothetical protein
MLRKTLAVLMVLSGLVQVSPAQGSPGASKGNNSVANFSGTWVMNVDKSDLGEMPRPKSQTLTITQTVGEVKVAFVSENEMGKLSYNYSAKLDGTETPFPSDAFPAESPFRIVSSKAALKGNTLVVMQKTSIQQMEGSLTTTYLLSADGKLLMAASHIAFGDAGFDTKTVYEKK